MKPLEKEAFTLSEAKEKGKLEYASLRRYSREF
jgi:hypothetical protein